MHNLMVKIEKNLKKYQIIATPVRRRPNPHDDEHDVRKRIKSLDYIRCDDHKKSFRLLFRNSSELTMNLNYT